MFSLKDACLAWLRPDYLYICTIYVPLKIQLPCLFGFGHEELIVSCDFSPVLRRGMWLGGVSHFLRGVRRDFKTWWCHSCILLWGVDKSFRHREPWRNRWGRRKNPANAYEKIKGLYLLIPNRNRFGARCPSSERTQTQQQGKSRVCLMAGIWLPTIGGRGRFRIWEWGKIRANGGKRERAVGRKLPGDRRGWLKEQGIFSVEFK